MMFGFIEAPIEPTAGCQYVARIDFLAGERQYKSGEDFDPSEHGLTEQQAMMLWNSGHLLVKPKLAQPAQPKPAARARR
jgi:hypothetical protein